MGILSIHDVKTMAPFFLLIKRLIEEMKILLESPSSNLRETRNFKLDIGPRNSYTELLMIKGR
jgi:hypothetical protein